MKTFIYKGYELKPLGNIVLKGKAVNKSKAIVIDWSYKLEIEGYTHKDFYKQAKKQGCSVDLFEYNGRPYITLDKCLVGIVSSYMQYFKPISEYKKWYKRYNDNKQHVFLYNSSSNELDYVYNVDPEELRKAIAYCNDIILNGEENGYSDIEIIDRYLDEHNVDYECEYVNEYKRMYY